MSTADPALLRLASIFTRDIFAEYFAKRTDQMYLTRVSKWVSWSVMAVLVTLALAPLGGLIRLFNRTEPSACGERFGSPRFR